jgi:hypothetical protein
LAELDSISRRRFLAATAPVLVLGYEAAPGWARPGKKAKPKRKAFYVLQPEYDRSARCRVPEKSKPDNCHGCKACHRHAKNKLFATRRAANRNRAHKGCKCKVVRGGTLDAATWSALFGGLNKPKRFKVDRRSRRVHSLLVLGRRRRRRRKNK